jgi:hypothetical protein
MREPDLPFERVVPFLEQQGYRRACYPAYRPIDSPSSP